MKIGATRLAGFLIFVFITGFLFACNSRASYSPGLINFTDSKKNSLNETLEPLEFSPTSVPSHTPIESTPTAQYIPAEETTTTHLSSTVTPTPGIFPEEYYIKNITGHKQYFSLGCETSAAIDVANYFGITINEFEFQHRLPLSDNPDLGFVGSVNGPWGQIPPYAYGVHAEPIAKLLSEYGLAAKGIKDFTLEQVKNEISNDRPVIAWVIGNVVGGVPYEFTDKAGNKTIVAAYEHVIIITGFSHEKIRYINNGNFFETPYDIFLNSWGVLGNMVVIKKD